MVMDCFIAWTQPWTLAPHFVSLDRGNQGWYSWRCDGRGQYLTVCRGQLGCSHLQTDQSGVSDVTLPASLPASQTGSTITLISHVFTPGN